MYGFHVMSKGVLDPKQPPRDAPPRKDLGTDAADRPCQLKDVEGRKALPVWLTWPPAPGTKPQCALLRGPRIKGMQESRKSLNSFEKQNRVKTCYSK